MGSVVSYSNDIKMDELGVSPELIESHGAVSAEVAEAMAIGAKKKFDVDYAMSTSGIAGLMEGLPINPSGLWPLVLQLQREVNQKFTTWPI